MKKYYITLVLLALLQVNCVVNAQTNQTKRTIHVATAGTLPNIISEDEKYEIEELTLTGELNGTDFRLIRDMAGCNYLGENTLGKLEALDMSEAKVVKGGDACVSTNKLAGWGGQFVSKIEEDNSFPSCVFMGCDMSSVKLPQTITSIGNWAFYGNSRLASIDIPNNVRSIGTRTFQNCSGIISILIPNSMTSIADDAFNGCSGILSLRVEKGNTTYDSRNDCNAIIETSTNTLILGCKNTTMPNDLQGIGSFAFYRRSTPVSIVLPKTVTSIGEYAFGYCTNLKAIDLPDGMTQIGYYAFEGCSALESVEIPPNLTSLGFAAFRSCSSITSISIPKSLPSISECAFQKCSKLNMVTMQNTVNSIGNKAFQGCSSLTSITIPNSVKKIGEKAFADCSSLTSIISKIVNPFEIQDVFSADTYDKAILTVPAGKKTSYQAINEWNKFARIIEGEQEEVTTKMTIHVASAGTLPELIPSDVRNDLEELTLTGELNGTDFRLLRELGGCDYLGNETSCQLMVLDFSEARIVKGGERYVDTDHLPGRGGNFRYTVEKDNIIPAHVFHGCKFKSVDISNSVTSIENYAFNNCKNLTSVTIPNSVTKIGDYVFEGCVSLISITIPKSVTIIGNEAFRYCNSLSSITIPNSVTNIGNNIILDCEILSTVIVESGNVKYDSRNDCNAIIETASNTLLAGCRNSTIPNSVTSIGKSAFSVCRNLASIEIPSSVTTIGDWAFNFCDKLTSLTIPNSVVFIGSCAFRCCNSLSSIIIPRSVQTIKSDSFAQCEHIKSIIVESDNACYDSRNNCNAIIETASNTLVKGCETTIIPNGVTSIGKHAFEECEGLTSITIPNSVTSIGELAFHACYSLKTVTSLIRSPFKIYNVFNYLPIDAELIVPYGTKSRYEAAEGWNVFSKITEDAQQSYSLTMTTDGHGSILFEGKSYRDQSKNVTIMEGSTVILTISPDDGYFASIKENNIDVTAQVSDNKYTISDFGGDTNIEVKFCNSSRSIHVATAGTLPDLISEDEKFDIEELTLTGELNGTDIKFIREMAGYSISRNKENIHNETEGRLRSLDITNTRIVKGGDAHDYYLVASYDLGFLYTRDDAITPGLFTWTKLESILLPNSVTSISGMSYWEADLGNQYMGAFPDCLTSVTIPKSVSSIGDNVFYGCNALTSIKVDSGNEKYDSRDDCNAIIETSTNSLIAGCKNTITPNSVTTIGQSAFAGCNGLTSVTIPNSVTTIGQSAFLDCNGLTSVTIPKSVMSIGSFAFKNCRDLTSVHISDMSAWCRISFSGYSSFSTPYHLYLNGEEIKDLIIPSDITSIGNYTFYNCSGLTSVTIPNSVTSIANYAFCGCSNLTSVSIPNSVTSIGNYAFNSCSGLNSVIIPNSVTSIGGWAFYNCSSLASAIIGNGVTSIGSAFYYCNSLEEMILSQVAYDNGIPESVTKFTTYSKNPMRVEVVSKGVVSATMKIYPIDEQGNTNENNYYTVTTSGQTPGQYIKWKLDDENYGIISEVTEGSLILETQPAQPMSTTKARLIATVNEADDDQHYGFEWLRYNAPDEMPPYKVSAPLYDGHIIGSLGGLNPDIYYKYRAFYKSDAGEMVYGEWVPFLTGDANVFFEPEVHTKEAVVINDGALLSAVFIEGTEDIQEKGFEYWPMNSNARAVSLTRGNNIGSVIVSGNNTSVTIEGLEAGTEYGYRPYVKTASGTTYGEEKTFVTSMFGDVNGDNKVDHDDLNDLVSYIMGNNPEHFDKDAADLNNDKKVNAADIVKMVKILK